MAMRRTSATSASVHSSASASSAAVGVAPSAIASRRSTACSLRTRSPTCTGRRTVRPFSDIARPIAWRIHSVA